MSDLFTMIAERQRAAAEAADPVVYVPKSDKQTIRNLPVHSLYLLCHPMNFIPGTTTSTNHWTLSFDTGNSKGVGLDVQPNPQLPYSNGGCKASIIVSEIENVEQINAEAEKICRVSVTNQSQQTIGWYIDYLNERDRFKYAFHGEGVGCRNWIQNTVQLLAEAGQIDQNEGGAATTALSYLWPSQQYSPPTKGVYF